MDKFNKHIVTKCFAFIIFILRYSLQMHLNVTSYWLKTMSVSENNGYSVLKIFFVSIAK